MFLSNSPTFLRISANCNVSIIKFSKTKYMSTTYSQYELRGQIDSFDKLSSCREAIKWYYFQFTCLKSLRM